MALVFTVGNPTDAFMEPHGTAVQKILEARFGRSMALDSSDDPWHTEELGWSGWATLQERALEFLAPDKIEHFLSMEAWKGAYLPVETAPTSLDDIPGDKTPLKVASLPRLIEELTLIGRALKLPTDKQGLESLAQKYLEDDDLIDEDMEIQTYAQLFLAAYKAVSRNQPLWVVK
jgi:hypothetical protein